MRLEDPPELALAIRGLRNTPGRLALADAGKRRAAERADTLAPLNCLGPAFDPLRFAAPRNSDPDRRLPARLWTNT